MDFRRKGALLAAELGSFRGDREAFPLRSIGKRALVVTPFSRLLTYSI